MHPFPDPQAHLRAELARLDLLLRRQVVRLRAADPTATGDPYRGLYVPDVQVDGLLRGDARSADPEDARALTAEIARLQAQNRVSADTIEEGNVRLPLLQLAESFRLSDFEIDVLLVAIAPELDARYETLYAYVQNDATRKRPTVGLALAMLCDSIEERLARRVCFDPDAALIANGLLHLCDDPGDREPVLPARFLKADPRAVDYILGVDTVDARLRPFVTIVRDSPFSRLKAVEDELPLSMSLRADLRAATDNPRARRTVFFFHGPAGTGRRAAAEATCAQLGLPLLIADLGRAAAEMSLRDALALLRREASLHRAALYLDGCEKLLLNDEVGAARTELARALNFAPSGSQSPEDTGQGIRTSRITGLAASTSFRPVFLSSEIPWGQAGVWGDTRFLTFTFPMPAAEERMSLWEKALATSETPLAPDLDLAVLADRFALSRGQIVDAVRAADRQATVRIPAERRITSADLYAAARSESGGGLARLVQKIEPSYTWDDIVLPRRQMQALREICAAVRFRHVVHTVWGFDRKLALGKGLTALFSGSSGTGKTMASQVIAHELGLDLYRIDLSSVVSKYIGETEKNLSQIFRAAEASNTILFFDEADALFGKRSEVKDAHDRYANIEVAYLLQKMEEYRGVAILATNLSRNMDDAFARRLSHTVEFPFPDAAHRERIWRQVFPQAAPVGADVDFPFLAGQFQLSGGNIRNVALTAAFMAASDGGVIGMRQLIAATARELEKLGKLPSRADFRDYYDWLRDGG